MVEIQDFISFVAQKADEERRERQQQNLLSEDALAARGLLLRELWIQGEERGELLLEGPPQDSRLRPGDRVELSCEEQKCKGVIRNIRQDGRQILLTTSRSSSSLPEGPWTACEIPIDLSQLMFSALNKIQRGGPGWAWFELMTGQRNNVEGIGGGCSEEQADQIPQNMEVESGVQLDMSQRNAFRACLRFPLGKGVQGPPGTGKTLVLAFVTEALVRMDKRIIVTAPTHQAVNNALSTVKRLFPKRKVVKAGKGNRRESLLESIDARPLRKGQGIELNKDAVVGMTFLSALHQFGLRNHAYAPNVLIIEEAGQLPLHQGITSGLLGASSTLLFGDDMQMPPIFPSDMRGEVLATSVFAALRESDSGAIQPLAITYRMNSTICSAVRDCFYLDQGVEDLRPSAEAETRSLSVSQKSGAPEVCRALIDESSIVWAKSKQLNCRQVNKQEAGFIAELTQSCLSSGVAPEDIAVVTPFRRQSTRIRNKLLADGVIRENLPIIDTVERVQGLTVDVVLVSLCASDPAYARELASFLFSKNRLNVSVSRARKKTIVAAAPAVLRSVPNDYKAVLGQQAWRDFLSCAEKTVDLNNFGK